MKASVESAGLLEQLVLGEVLGEDVDVGEVTSFGAPEQGEQLAAGELERDERWPEESHGRRRPRRRIDREVNEDLFPAIADHEATERRAVMDSVDGVLTALERPDQRCLGLGRVCDRCRREEVEVLRRPVD